MQTRPFDKNILVFLHLKIANTVHSKFHSGEKKCTQNVKCSWLECSYCKAKGVLKTTGKA